MIINLGFLLLVLSFCAGVEYDDDDYDDVTTKYSSENSIEDDRRRLVITEQSIITPVSTTTATTRSTKAATPRTIPKDASMESNWPPKHEILHKNTEVTEDDRKLIDTTPETETQHVDAAQGIDHVAAESIVYHEDIESNWPPKYETFHKNTEVTKDDRKFIDTTPEIEAQHVDAAPGIEHVAAEVTVDREDIESNWPPKYETFHKNTEVTKDNRKVIKTTPKIETQHVDTARRVDHPGAELTVDRGGIANYPFSVSLQKMGSHYASGALVGKQWVMSAAQDFYNVRESIKVFRARLGSVDCKRGGQLLPMKRIEIHPSFAPGKPDNDVSLLQLAKPVEFTDLIKPIFFTKILVKEKLLSAKFLATYWPRVIINGTVLPSEAKERKMHTRMRVSTQRLITWEKCANILSKLKEVLPKSNMCLKPVHSHHSICLPDVGAPILSNDGLWGITSGWVSHNCSANPSPTIATRVSTPSVLMWFDGIVFEDDD